MKAVKVGLLSATGLFVLGFAALWGGFHVHPDISHWQRQSTAPAPADALMTVTFLGVSTVLFNDGKTAWITDGFFSRPSALQTAFAPVSPDSKAIDAALSAANIQKLAAVVVLHSHYDHAMDAPTVAMRTGALVIGSASTAFIAQGQGLPDSRIQRIPAEGARLQIGAFDLQLIPSVHAPEDHFPGEITAPLVPPSPASAYRTGTAYSLVVRHHGKTLLMQASAGFVPGALDAVQADTVLLGVGLLGKQTLTFQQAYWQAVVQKSGAKQVIPIHWDDFFRPLSAQPLLALPRLADRVPKSLRFVEQQSLRDGRVWAMPSFGQAFDPFLNSPP